MGCLNIHDGLLPCSDAVFEVLSVARTLEDLNATAGCLEVLGLLLGVRRVAVPVSDC